MDGIPEFQVHGVPAEDVDVEIIVPVVAVDVEIIDALHGRPEGTATLVPGEPDAEVHI